MLSLCLGHKSPVLGEGQPCGGYAGCPLTQDLSAHHRPFPLESCLELSWEGTVGAGRTWRQGTKGTHSLSCCIPPCAVGAMLQHCA